MVEGVRLAKKELIARFGLTARMAARVGALLAEKVELTQAVLELAQPGNAMERYLLLPELLDLGNRVTTSKLKDLARKSDLRKLFEDTPLVARKSGGLVTIALEEEARAEKAWRAEAASEEAGRALVVRRGEVPAPEETELAGLFTEQELRRIKLTIMTSAKADEKIEAIRKLRLAPMSARQRGRLLVGLLGDDSAAVRSEAAMALRDLGLSADLAQSVRDLFMGTDLEKAAAAQAISRIAQRGEALEGAVLFVVITRALREEADLAVQGQLIEALVAMADQIGGELACLEESVKILVRRAGANLAKLGGRIAAALRDLATHDPRAVSAICWQMLRDLRETKLRAFLLARLGEIGAPAELQDELARAALYERLKFSDLDRYAGELGAVIVRLGDAGLKQVLARLAASREGEFTALARLLDDVCQKGRVSAGGIKAAGLALLEALSRAKGERQGVLLDLRTLTDHRLPKSLRRDIAREVVRVMSGVLLDRSLDAAEDVLADLGLPALGALKERLEGKEVGPSKARTVQAIGAVVQEASEATKEELVEVRRAMAMCSAGMKKGEADEGAFAVALGRMAASPIIDERNASGVLNLLRTRLRDGRQPFKVLEGIGWAASNEKLSMKAKTEVSLMFINIFQGEMPEHLLDEEDSEEGVVFTVRPEAAAYSEMIPAVVEGLKRICFSISERSPLIERIVSVLLDKWEEVSTWKVIWGPANISLLSDALVSIASLATVSSEMRLQVARTLRRHLTRLSVVRGIGAIMELDSGSKEMGALALEIGEELVEVRAQDKFLTPEERAAILAALTAVASRYYLGDNAQRVARLRSRVVSLLENALRVGVADAYENLLKISKSAGLSDFQKSEIQRRLSRFTRVAAR